MKKIISLAICILVLLSCFTIVVSAEDELLENPVEIEVPEGFEPISFFSGGTCFIKKDQEIGLLSTDGAFTSLGQFEFDEAGAMPSLENIDGSFNFGGPFVTLSTFDDEEDFPTEEYLCKDGNVYDYVMQSESGNYFAEKNGLYGALDSYGKVVVPCTYNWIQFDATFNEGMLAVAKGVVDVELLWTYLKEDGTLLGDYEYLSAGRFSNGLAPVSYFDEESEEYIFGYIDKNGTVKFEIESGYAEEFYNNYAFSIADEYDSEFSCIDSKVEIYDTKGNKVEYKDEIKAYELIIAGLFDEDFDFLSESSFSEYTEIVALNMVFNPSSEDENEYILFNTKTGEFYDENTYSEVISVNEDMICVQNSEGLFGFVNTEGEEVVPCIYADANDFSNGYASVANDELLYGYIDKTGKVVIPLQYSDAGPFTEGLAPVANEDGKFGAINDKGETVIEFEYDMLSGFYNGLSMFVENEGIGLIDKDGEVVVPAEYMMALPFGPDNYPMVMNMSLSLEELEEEMFGIYLHSLNFDGSELIEGDYDVCLAAGDGMIICGNIEDEELSIFKIKETETGTKVSNVNTLIDALPETLSDDDLDDIKAAVNAYEALNYEQQQILSQNNKLREAQKYLIEKDIDSYLKGDINGDNRVTVSDIVTLRAIIMGDLKPTALQEILCDVDGDNRQTVTDIVNLRSIIMGD